MTLLCGDYRTTAVYIPAETVQLVFCETSRPQEAEDAASVAARILKPGGSFLCRCSHASLPTTLASAGKHLRYWWTLARVHGVHAIPASHDSLLSSHWEPVIWFVKGTRGDKQRFLVDLATGDREAFARYYIDRLTCPGGHVVDLFGDRATRRAAESIGRTWIGFAEAQS